MPKRSTNTSKTSPKLLTAKENALKALELRKRGWSFQKIADEIGYKSESGARNAVNRLLQKTEFEAVKDYRKLKLLQLDELYQEVRQELRDEKEKVSLWVVDRLQSIIDQQSRLLGLYTLGDLNAAYDWRQEFKDAGIEPDDLINELFDKVLAAQEAAQNKQGSD